ncbi:hypothetical protein ACJQWK_00755 [Exserohilum turcicum]|uniref:Uncharacterized protein n=1 Tax=Exserohilum turcicum (strain 28A) TaxID=671987 RepID=R0JRJ4_EXST2|nr:uncharacterized protein SETTUDRAFT_21092 [Exserohilum turcica Et28A]EOA83738.1 hypothetical protein SETTUDRAFT_21092 [Exserohilum turcica Et28A]
MKFIGAMVLFVATCSAIALSVDDSAWARRPAQHRKYVPEGDYCRNNEECGPGNLCCGTGQEGSFCYKDASPDDLACTG